MRNLIFLDITIILILSLIFLLVSFLLSGFKSKRILDMRIASFGILIAIALSIGSIVIAIKNHCGTEVCYYHGWPHFLYISSNLPSYDITRIISFPLYIASNIFFYFSLAILGLSIYRRFK